jgi:hypothetical protein
MGFLKATIRSLSDFAHTDKEFDLTLHRLGELAVTDTNGKYYLQNYNLNMFYGTTTNAGVAIPADNATAQTFAVWNPAGSGKLLVPVHLRMGIVTLGTRVVSSIQLNFLSNVGSQIATGSLITAWTDTVPQSANIGSNSRSNMRFALAATTTAATSYWQTGLYHDLAAGGSAPPLVVDFDGTLIVRQGTAMFLQSADAATGSTYAITMSWLELPL